MDFEEDVNPSPTSTSKIQPKGDQDLSFIETDRQRERETLLRSSFADRASSLDTS